MSQSGARVPVSSDSLADRQDRAASSFSAGLLRHDRSRLRQLNKQGPGPLRARLEPADHANDVQPRSDGPLSIILVSSGIAEVRQHAVAHVFGNKPGVGLDHLGGRGLIGADDYAQILRVHPRRKRG